MGILHDITQQKEVQEANNKLRQAKDRLIMTVSHEVCMWSQITRGEVGVAGRGWEGGVVEENIINEI